MPDEPIDMTEVRDVAHEVLCWETLPRHEVVEQRIKEMQGFLRQVIPVVEKWPVDPEDTNILDAGASVVAESKYRLGSAPGNGLQEITAHATSLAQMLVRLHSMIRLLDMEYPQTPTPTR